MRVSVIIVTYRRPSDLDEALASVLTQRRRPDEVLVVAQPDDAATRPVAEAYAAKTGGFVRLVRNDRGDALTIARNVGVDAARGDVLVFLDDDVVLHPAYLAEVAAHFEAHPGALGAQGHWASDASRSMRGRAKVAWARLFLLTRYEARGCRVLPSGHLTYPLRPSGPTQCQWLSGCNMAYRRAVFAEQRFEERLRRGAYGEDWDFSHRLWQRRPGCLTLLPAARLVHKSSPLARAPVRDLVVLREAYAAFLRARAHPGALARVARAYSRAGELLQYAAFALLAQPRSYHRAYLRHWLAARAFCRKHRAALRAGDLSALAALGAPAAAPATRDSRGNTE